jgi:hypothetical protein
MKSPNLMCIVAAALAPLSVIPVFEREQRRRP